VNGVRSLGLTGFTSRPPVSINRSKFPILFLQGRFRLILWIHQILGRSPDGQDPHLVVFDLVAEGLGDVAGRTLGFILLEDEVVEFVGDGEAPVFPAGAGPT
jgi:hypothetical protein